MATLLVGLVACDRGQSPSDGPKADVVEPSEADCGDEQAPHAEVWLCLEGMT